MLSAHTISRQDAPTFVRPNPRNYQQHFIAMKKKESYHLNCHDHHEMKAELAGLRLWLLNFCPTIMKKWNKDLELTNWSNLVYQQKPRIKFWTNNTNWNLCIQLLILRNFIHSEAASLSSMYQIQDKNSIKIQILNTQRHNTQHSPHGLCKILHRQKEFRNNKNKKNDNKNQRGYWSIFTTDNRYSDDRMYLLLIEISNYYRYWVFALGTASKLFRKVILIS